MREIMIKKIGILLLSGMLVHGHSIHALAAEQETAGVYVKLVTVDEQFYTPSEEPRDPKQMIRGTILKEGAAYRIRCLTLKNEDETTQALGWETDPEGYLSFDGAGTKENPFVTAFVREEGKICDCAVTLPQMLPEGTYELTQQQEPKGYVGNGNEKDMIRQDTDRIQDYTVQETPKEKLRFTVDRQCALPDAEGKLTLTVCQINQPQKGTIQIYKYGEQLAAYSQEDGWKYENAPMEGAAYEIIAASDIYTQELDPQLLGSYRIDRDSYLMHRRGTVVTTIRIGQNGYGFAMDLHLGKYRIVEKEAGEGLILNTSETVLDITSRQGAAFRGHIIHYERNRNQRQTMEISVSSTDAETGEALTGAKYGLYTAQDMMTNLKYDEEHTKWIVRDLPEILVPKGTLAAEAVADSSGNVTFPGTLPLGKYELRELEAPSGYERITQPVIVDASYDGEKGGQTVKKQVHEIAFASTVLKPGQGSDEDSQPEDTKPLPSDPEEKPTKPEGQPTKPENQPSKPAGGSGASKGDSGSPAPVLIETHQAKKTVQPAEAAETSGSAKSEAAKQTAVKTGDYAAPKEWCTLFVLTGTTIFLTTCIIARKKSVSTCNRK